MLLSMLDNGGGVRLSWTKNNSHLKIQIEDDGPGLSNTANLFVPFYTTKPGGTGIGLALIKRAPAPSHTKYHRPSLQPRRGLRLS